MGLELILKYFPELTGRQREHFAALGALYADWNERVNLISRKDFEHLYERHILHSLGIAQVFAFAPGTRIVDVGTGGGFPLVPLAILFPESSFHGIDGIEDNAGAIVTPDTLARGLATGRKAQEFLDRNDAYNYFASLGDLVTSGPTYTNVNDFRALLIL